MKKLITNYLNKAKLMSIHILPINDIKQHEETTTCECSPSVEFENGEMIIIHNSFDNREIKN